MVSPSGTSLIVCMPEHSAEAILWKGRPIDCNCLILMSRKEKIRSSDQEPEINNAIVTQELGLFISGTQLKKMQCIQALGVFASIVTSPRVPLRTGSLGVVETNDWKCFLLEAICNMLLILPLHKISSLSTFVGAIKEMSTIPEKFIYQAFNWKVPKLLCVAGISLYFQSC